MKVTSLTRSQIYQMRKLICEFMGIDVSYFYSEAHKTRKIEFVRARQISCYFLKKYTGYSLNKIGKLNLGIDHASALASIRRINNLLDTERIFRAQIFELDLKIAKVIAGEKKPVQDLAAKSTDLPLDVYVEELQEVIMKQKELIEQLQRNMLSKLDEKLQSTLHDQKDQIRKLNETIQDKDREIRFLKGQVQRSKIPNAYQYTS
jgi:hypothetical protein